ncbi:MAG: M24 family metallopeptidase [Thermoanaerobaculia bacterium]|nr:M24 family metallopeptidase [Thermoanaerobaculia bacterium]
MLGPLQEELVADECEALLVLAPSARDVDLAPFVGSAHIHSAFVIVPRQGDAWLGYMTPMERQEAASTGLRLLTPEALDVARWARGGAGEEQVLAAVILQGLGMTGVHPGRLALGGHPSAGVLQELIHRLDLAGWSTTSGRSILRRLRKTKTREQIDAAARAGRGAVAAMRRVAEVLRSSVAGERTELHFEGEALTVGRLRREIAVILASHGLEQPEGNIVAPGSQGGVPHTAGNDDSVLLTGRSLVVDLYPRGVLFADCTRTFCVGEPPEPLRRAHATVEEALHRSRKNCRVGRKAWDLQVEVCDFLAANGYSTPLTDPGAEHGYVHGLGHGVGFELHELPTFRQVDGREGDLEIGDVITLEPGLYLPSDEGTGYGVRLEDTLVLTEDGATVLTSMPYALDPRAWED